MPHPLKDSDEREVRFLKRMEDQASDGPKAIVDARDITMLIQLVRHWRRLETEAAKHVETVIVMHSPRFTGHPPYVGWEGLGLALREDYAELDRLKLEQQRTTGP